MSKGYGPYFQEVYNLDKDDNNRPGYIRSHYDTYTFVSGSLSKQTKYRNVIGRIRNNFIDAINKQGLLPKIIFIVLEDDLPNAVNHYKVGCSLALEPLVSWKMEELHEIVTKYKEKLLTKSRKFRYLQFMWISCVYHDQFTTGNYYREKFNRELMQVSSKYREMHTLHLASWHTQDKSLVSHGSLTSKGLAKYWIAVNDAFQAWDKQQMRNNLPARKLTSERFERFKDDRTDKSRWSSRDYNSKH